jgi:hypothetical protein
MRRLASPIQPAPIIHIALAERIRAAAARLEAMPAAVATSLSITAGRQGLSEAEIRDLARGAGAPAGFESQVQAQDGTVTVTFRRPSRRRG